ncbi:Ff.00g012110.m01.CDS01 [Fusarium sp. VM40]|nr:Ff.00g012110.m01.CDS01 [Fusarium sp. VM40]
MRLNATETSSVRRPSSTTASREPVRARGSYSSDDESGRDITVFEANGRSFELERNFLRRDQNYVDGHNRPGHSAASKLQRQGPRALSDVCNKDTISRDNTVGNQAQMDEALASFGKKVFGMHYHELREQSHTEPVYSCKYCLKTFDTRKEESRHRIYLWPSDPSRGRCKTWEEYYDEKNSNSKRRQRQQLAQDEYEDETEADLREIGPRTIPKEYSDKANAALDYIQASRDRARQYAKAERDLESDDDSSESGDGAEYEELSDYVY